MTDNKSKRISTFGSRFTSMMSVCMVLLLLGLAGLTAIVTHRLDNDVLRNIGFVVLLERECPSEDINILKRELLQSPGIESIEFKSAEEILAEESDFMGEDIAALIDANPYSGEIDVKVRPAYASPDSIAGLTDYVSHFAGVHDIVTEIALIEGVHTMSRRITAVLLALAVLLLVISVALIGNAVSLS
ncbi:MAG: permease-like cell division protein FtsX, partial [Muribaculaceae bacterium]|nr:permease-like cell division protein FtsX [Muribaculaceae bacterium]